ncbi:MAG: hypothetical protein FK730_11360 [Asgard group archaeon]|nr:hypothetical protein [Asgard group archaeon]
MSEEEKTQEEIAKELAFYRNQTKVLREKNRDLRNALLLAESNEGIVEQKETTEDSLSDIRKIIADSKKQITDKLTQFKEDIEDEKTKGEGSAPEPGKYELTQVKSTDQSSAPISVEAEALIRQSEYLKEEVERLENFLEQSEMVNSRLQELLTKHNIDVTEITKAISEVSKTTISKKAIPTTESQKEPVIPEPVIKQPVKSLENQPVVETQATISEPKPKPKEKKLDPEVVKLFDALRAKLSTGIGEDDIKMEILNFREKLMDLIPHSRVFYEMQVEYRRWKRGTSSLNELKDVIKEWEKTIASM